MRITVTVDGTTYTDEVEPRLLLVHYLRDRLGKVGTVVGCDTSNCGACTVHLNGSQRQVLLGARRAGRRRRRPHRRGPVPDDGTLHPVQEAFRDNHALQCGFCTPGMIMQTLDLLAEEPDPDERDGAAGSGRQPVPLHRVPEHRQRGAGRGAAAARRRHRRRHCDRMRRKPTRPGGVR